MVDIVDEAVECPVLYEGCFSFSFFFFFFLPFFLCPCGL